MSEGPRASRQGGAARSRSGLWCVPELGGSMRLIKYAHACVRLESDSGVLVIDPGGFSEREALTGADAVLVTHEHMDHLLVDAVVDEHAQRPGLRVFPHAEVAPKLDAIASAVTAVAPGDAFEAAGFRV